MNEFKSNPTQSILLLALACVLFYFWLQLLWLLHLAIALSIIGILSDSLSKKLEFIWMQFAKLLAFVMPKILLTLVYFLLLVPIAFLSRIFNKTDLLKKKKPAHSTFIEVNKQFAKSDFEKMW
jgi:hypothetical protein